MFFGKVVHIFAWKLVSRTSKQVARNWGHYGNWGFRMTLTLGAFSAGFRNPLAPYRDQNPPNWGKRVSESKTHFQPPQKRVF